MNKLIQTIFSYNGDVLLAGIVSLLLVILFVLLLHVYGKWLLAHGRHRRRSSVSLSRVLGPARLRRINSLIFDTTLSASLTEGLEASAIASIPLFVYESVDRNQVLECVICLSLFQEGELGRKLPNCGHEFHVQCVDTWLNSHSNCPICRSAVGILGEGKVVEVNSTSNGVVDEEAQLEIVVEGRNSHENSNGIEVTSDEFSARLSSASLSSQMTAMGGSLKRMVSKNISERKIHPSSSYLHEPED